MDYRVAFKHYRIPEDWQYEPVHYQRKKTKWTPQAKGGKTECFLYSSGYLVAKAETVCSKDDNFCYREGRHWAFLHALDHVPQLLYDTFQDMYVDAGYPPPPEASGCA